MADVAFAASQAAVAELVAGLENVCAVQKKYYGNGTGLHLAMIDVADDARELLAKHRAPTADPNAPTGSQVVGVHYEPESDHDRPPGCERP